MIALAGLAKRADLAREAFSELVERTSIEVLDYRIEQRDDSYPLRSITDSLSGFQAAVTATYDSKLNGPKVKARVSQQVSDRSSLNFELFYPGSKGFILSVPSEEDLFGGAFDETVDAVRDYLAISSTDQARDASRQLGLAAVSTLYRWVATNARWGNTIDYEWKARRDRITGERVPYERFAFLEEIFRGAEEVEQLRTKRRGVLVGLDVSKRVFNFAEPDGDAFRGSLNSEFVITEYAVPRTYVADILVTTTRMPATGEERQTNALIALDLVDSG
jgi:hypothetical protein